MTALNKTKVTANKLKNFIIELTENDLELAISLAEIYADFLMNNSIGIYSDIDLENYLAKHFYHLIKKDQDKPHNLLHLITTAYPYGGHTRVVENFLINGFGEGIASLDEIPELVEHKIPEKIIIKSNLRTQFNLKTIENIVNAGINYKNIILHIHPNDICSAISSIILKKSGVNIYFYNHADHLFSYGFGAANKVFEISKLGWSKGNQRNILGKQSFAGIPIKINEYDFKIKNLPKKPRIVIAGSPTKFVPWKKHSVPLFIKFFVTLIDIDLIDINIIGPSGKEDYWATIEDRVFKKIKLLGRLPHDEYIKLIDSSDIYIDSFPFPNGTGFSEAICRGLPVFGLDILGGYSYADFLRSHSVFDLSNDINNYINNTFEKNKKISKAHELLVDNQSIEKCIDRIRYSMETDNNIPLPKELGDMHCMEDFFEKKWQSENRIVFYLKKLSKFPLKQRIRIILCWRDAWPFLSTIDIIKRLFIKKINGTI